MNTIRRGWWLLLLPLAACNPADEAPAEAIAPDAEVAEVADEPADGPAAGVNVSDPWVRAMPPSAAVAAGYLTLHNAAARPLRLLAVESPMASVVEIHEMRTADGMMQMRRLAEGLLIEPGQTVNLEPGGLHLMMMDPMATFSTGDTVPLTLRFDDAPAITLDAPVRMGAPAGADDGGMAGHDH